MLKKPRGTYDECLTVVDGVPITTTVSWKDNKIVNVTSTFIGALEPTKVRRYDKKQKKNVDVERPKIIEVYNKHMGGVDLMDSLIGRREFMANVQKNYGQHNAIGQIPRTFICNSYAKWNRQTRKRQALRRDCLEHWPNYEQQRRVCKMPKCKFQSFTKCSKCCVYLCYNNDRNCFVDFHCS
ncbi:unnamed protein product [Macrosiphum euphorbiae]|uniref:PiggyBac transposable element-derived protein domain-containing protein n=1 Tax=Macrosiphum euphorbiae TaxID=13131 RepID=A0AAV0XZE4_9HEMI|nr:unnamed protein product [Macrosiphum euphorbiae]